MGNFNDPKFAASYAMRTNKRNIKRGNELADQLKAMGFKKGKVLDAGCGPGQTAVVLAKRFSKAEVVGMDLSKPLLKHGRKFAKQEGVKVKYEEGNLEKMPYDDDTFDVIITQNTLHEVNDQVAMLNELERILKPGGILLLGDIKRTWLKIVIPWMGHTLSLEEAKKYLKRSKLRKVKVEESFIRYTFTAGKAR